MLAPVDLSKFITFSRPSGWREDAVLDALCPAVAVALIAVLMS